MPILNVRTVFNPVSMTLHVRCMIYFVAKWYQDVFQPEYVYLQDRAFPVRVISTGNVKACSLLARTACRPCRQL